MINQTTTTSASVGPIIFDLDGLHLTAEEKDILQHPLIGGVILFSRNYESPQQLSDLTEAIRSIKKTPLLICVDQEGGRVQRFRNGFTSIPTMQKVGNVFQKDSTEGLRLANACGYVIAAELLQVGIDLSFAPVLDLNKVINVAINDRTFSADNAEVVKLAQAFIEGMHEAGMANCGKHFPGHGSVCADSHHELPEDLRAIEQVIADDLQPFVKLKLASIMGSHILFPKIDNVPVCFSKKWLTQILRDTLKFSGVIFSDDLSMQGAKVFGNCIDRTEKALSAGCDMVLICNNRKDVVEALKHLPKDITRISMQKFAPLQGNFAKDFSLLNERRELIYRM